MANGTSWRQAPSKPEYGGWTFGVGCRSAEVADSPVEQEGEEEVVGGGGAALLKPAAAAPAAPVADAAAPVGPAGPGSLSAPIKGYLSGRASVAELQPGIESAAECASICAAAEKGAASSCAGYSWCGAAAGCPGNVATGVCQLWSGKAGSGKLSPNGSGWISAAREVVSAVSGPQPAMKTQTAAAGA